MGQESSTNQETERKQEDIQCRVFREWCNFHLKKKGIKIEENKISEAFTDGITFCILYENLSKEKLNFNPSPQKTREKMENTKIVLERVNSFVNETGIGLQFGVSDFFPSSSDRLILGFVWVIITKFCILESNDEQGSRKGNLRHLCRETIKDYERVAVKNFLLKNWSDGVALLCLIHQYDHTIMENLLDPKIQEELQKEEHHRKNLELAFNFAEEKFGIPKLLRPDDLLEKNGNSKCLLIYLSMLFRELRKIREKDLIIQSPILKKDIKSVFEWVEAKKNKKYENLEELISIQNEREYYSYLLNSLIYRIISYRKKLRIHQYHIELFREGQILSIELRHLMNHLIASWITFSENLMDFSGILMEKNISNPTTREIFKELNMKGCEILEICFSKITKVWKSRDSDFCSEHFSDISIEDADADEYEYSDDEERIPITKLVITGKEELDNLFEEHHELLKKCKFDVFPFFSAGEVKLCVDLFCYQWRNEHKNVFWRLKKLKFPGSYTSDIEKDSRDRSEFLFEKMSLFIFNNEKKNICIDIVLKGNSVRIKGVFKSLM